VTIDALATTGQHSRTIKHPRPLWSVMLWELRRFRASRLFWLQALGAFCLVLLLTWAQRMQEQVYIQTGHVTFSAFVAGTSTRGLLHTLPLSLVVLVMFLPFVNADGVARDVSRRTHELLVTTALPTWAYVWGRYLIGLLVSLGLALLMLAAIEVMGLLLHLTIANYPAPELGNLMTLWVGMVVPATILVSSVSFALGTLLPRLTTLVKVAILVAWIVGGVILPAAARDTIPPTWYVNWDPTSAITGLGMLPRYSVDFRSVTNVAHLQQTLLAVENRAPDVSGWIVPHLLLAGLSLVLVLGVTLAFRRSRDTLD
jgi:ABC-type transport system involved in multi-copper enzyme maturation permease subunit